MEPVDQTDEAIIAAVLRGEINAYEGIIRRYNERLYRIGISILGDGHEVEDIMQNTYLKAYEKLTSFKQRSKFSTWLTRIMINECLARLRQSRRTERLHTIDEKEYAQPDAISHHPTPEQLLIQKEYARVLEQAIQALPLKHRTVFIMREVENISVKETAACMNLSQENIKVLLHRAKGLLRQHLQAQTGDIEVFSFHLHRCDRMVTQILAQLTARSH